MVAVVDIPSPCASRMTSSQGSVRVFRGATSFRTRSTSISAPPPGNESNPAACSRMRVSLTVSPLPVSYTHLRAHETKANLVCRLLLEKKKKKKKTELYKN